MIRPSRATGPQPGSGPEPVTGREPAAGGRRSAGPLLVGLVVGILALTGCSVSVQDQAEALPSGALPALTTTPTPSPTTSPRAARSLVYFVSGPVLEPVEQPVASRTAEGVMEALVVGPPVERQAELRSLLIDPSTGVPFLRVTDVGPTGLVEVARTAAFGELPATDQALLMGQVVFSLDAVGLHQVLVTDEDGRPVPVTLPDARLRNGPTSAADFSELLSGPSPS